MKISHLLALSSLALVLLGGLSFFGLVPLIVSLLFPPALFATLVITATYDRAKKKRGHPGFIHGLE